MTGERFRIQVEEAYVAELGRAVFVFAVLEWNAVYCCDRLKPGYVTTVERKKKTAGGIAGDLLRFLRGLPGEDSRRECWEAAARFEELVDVRNALLHGKPGTANGGTQMLFHEGDEWTTEEIEAATDRFAACSIELNRLLHGVLKA